MSISARLQNILEGHSVNLGIMVYADFTSGLVRTWPGIGPLVTNHSTRGTEEWTGNGGMISISDIELSNGFFASTLTVTISGIPDGFPDFYAKALDQEQEVHGRRIIIFLQSFTDSWQPDGDFFAIWAGVMDRLIFNRRVDSKAISLQCETPFVTRRKPRYGFLTDEDQQRLFPGDRGLEFASAASEKQLTWPSY